MALTTFSGTYDASTHSEDLTKIVNLGSTVAFTVSGIGTNSAFFIDGASAASTLTFANPVLSSGTATFSLKVRNVTGGDNITINNTSSGSFGTISLDSRGTAANAVGTLGGTALASASILNISATVGDSDGTAAQDLTLTLSATTNSIRTLTSSSNIATTITFADTTTGTSSNALSATFSKAASKLQLSTTAALVGNTLSFTTSGTFALTWAATKASASGAVTDTTSNGITTFQVIDDADTSNTIDLTIFNDEITTLDLLGGNSGGATFTGISSSTVNIGASDRTGAPLSDTGGTYTLASAGSITYNVNAGTSGTADQSPTFSNATSATISLSNDLDDSNTITASGSNITSVTITNGPTVSSLSDSPVINLENMTSLTAVNASGTAGVITIQAPYTATVTQSSAADSAKTVSNTAGNDNFTTGDNAGGTGNDTYTFSLGGTDSVALGLGNDIVKYITTVAGSKVTITDFNPGTSASYIDRIGLGTGIALSGASGTNPILMNGDQSNKPTSHDETPVMETVTSLSSPVTISTSGVNIVKYTGTPSTPPVVGDFSNLGIGGAPTYDDLLLPVWIVDPNDTYAHLIILRYTIGATTPSALYDSIVLDGVTSLDNIDATDMFFIGYVF